jgi:hypothetical protein
MRHHLVPQKVLSKSCSSLHAGSDTCGLAEKLRMLYGRVVISASFHSSFLLANHEAFIARSLLLGPVRCVTIRPLPLSHVTRPTVELPKQPSEHHACDFIPADDPKPPPGDVSVTVQVFEALRFPHLTRLTQFQCVLCHLPCALPLCIRI